MVSYQPESAADRPAIEALLDVAFGSDRHAKASYALRRGIPPVPELCRVAYDAGHLVGTIRYWPVRVGQATSLLLGPVGVEPASRGRGIGRRLIEDSLDLARARGAETVFLVGDAAYYGRFGFAPVAPGVTMPSERPARLLGLVLQRGAVLPHGIIQPVILQLPAAG